MGMVVFKLSIIYVNNAGNLSTWTVSICFFFSFCYFQGFYCHSVPACRIIWQGKAL